MKANTQEEVINKLNPLLRGFANYYRGVVSKKIFSYIHNRMWQYLWRWAKRRHPNKGKIWIKNRYFQWHQGNEWTFMCQGTGRKGKAKTYILYNISKTPIVRHVKIKGQHSQTTLPSMNIGTNEASKTGKIIGQKAQSMSK